MPSAPRYPSPESNATTSDFRNVIASASTVLDQTPPPSLQDILRAYKARGDGDRDMLLAMLNAKAAEDQRIASVASLHRSLLDAYQTPHPPPPRSSYYHERYYDAYPSYQAGYRASRSRSPPPRTYRDEPIAFQPTRKRQRHSHSPSHSRPQASYDSHHEQLPPSPYSSAGSVDSELSPLPSRGTMTIDSLLTSGSDSSDDSQSRGRVSYDRNGARPSQHATRVSTQL